MTIGTKIKPYAFTGSGAAIGAVVGGPIGLAFGAGLGAVMDWWRKKNAPHAAPIEATIVPPPPTLHLLPLGMQHQPYAPATLDAIARLKPLKMKTPAPAPKKKPAPTPKPAPKKPPPAPSPQQSSGDASGTVDLSASASFSI